MIIKNFLYIAGIALFSITAFSSENSFASPAPTLASCGYECQRSLNQPQPNPLASEVISLFEKTFEQNFTTNIDFSFDINGEHFNWNDDKTTYSVSYDVNDASITKNNNAYHTINNNQKLSVSADGVESYFPLEIDATFTEEEILNFDTFQFAGKFSVDNIDTHGNDSVRHIVEGIMEFVELFENKWIVLDVLEIENEFPELAEYIQEMKADFEEESDLNGYEQIQWALSKLLETGAVSVEKKGFNYIISFTEEYISKTNPLQIILSTKNNTITNIAVKGSFNYKDSWREDTATINISSEISFVYKTVPVTFPKISADDWEITNILEMILEFTKDDIVEKSEKREFFENLNAFTGNSSDAITFLNANGTENDKAFVAEYVTNAKKLDRRIRSKDLRVIGQYYDFEEYQIEYLADDLSYSPYRDINDFDYIYKNGFETLIIVFQEQSNREYAYIPWDIYDELDYRLKTRGDVLISLAKVRKAELLMNK